MKALLVAGGLALALGAPGCSVESGGDGSSCLVRERYPSIPDGEATHGVDPADGAWLVFNAEIDDDPLNLLEVSMWSGTGVFAASEVATGSFDVTGDEADYGSCGVCVALFADVENEASSQLLAATSGTIEITSISGTMAGTLSDLVLVQVDGNTYEPVEDGCTTEIPAASFSATITEDDDGEAP
jgi:hypothetical protein